MRISHGELEQMEQEAKHKADVVEVVRCKDCKCWERRKARFGWCDRLELYPYPDWYCADGKRKETKDG